MKNQRTCSRCQHAFWAWETLRATCYICDPRRQEDARVLDQVYQEPYNCDTEAAINSLFVYETVQLRRR